MEEQSKIEKLVSDVKDYAETRLDIAVLEVQDKATSVISSIAASVVVGVIGVIVLLFLSIGAAWALGEYIHSPSIGFFSVAGFYLLLGLILYLGREKLIKLPIINAILKKITFHENN
jgi:hypothetical protein